MNNVFLRVLGVLGIIAIGVAIGIGVSMSRGQAWMKSDDASLASAINTRLHSDAELAAVDVRDEVNHSDAVLKDNVWWAVRRGCGCSLCTVIGMGRVNLCNSVTP